MQKVTVTLIDDLDETVSDDVQTVTFSHDGKAYEIDLGAATRAQLADALAPFKAAGRRSGGRSAAAAPSRTRSRPTSEAKQIREWAVGKGITVSGRGRIPEDVRAQYEAEQK